MLLSQAYTEMESPTPLPEIRHPISSPRQATKASDEGYASGVTTRVRQILRRCHQGGSRRGGNRILISQDEFSAVTLERTVPIPVLVLVRLRV